MGYRLLTYGVMDLQVSRKKLLGFLNPEEMYKFLAHPDYKYYFYNANEYLSLAKPEYVNDPQTCIKADDVYQDENFEITPLLIRSTVTSAPCITYICKSKKFLGQVHPEKLEALGVFWLFVF